MSARAAPAGTAVRRAPLRWLGLAFALGVVGLMLLSGWPILAGSLPSAGVPSARLGGVPAGLGGAAPPGSAHPGTLALPNGTCGIAKWCPAVTGSVTSYTTTTTGLLSAPGTVPCSVALISGACSAAAGASGKSAVTPYLNATNDVALNYTSAGVLAMAYTNYTTLAPTGASTCSPARPAATSEITFTTSTTRGASWAKPVLLGTPDCTNASSYPSAYDPALTSLGNGTIVLAYVQYAAKAPFIPPFINTSSVPLSRLVVTELYPGAPGWSRPDVVNVSNPSKSLTVAFSPARPSLGASGNTIYLTWMSLGTPVPIAVISHVAMLVSTTGGKSWSPTIQLSSGSEFAGNPNVLVQPGTGELYVAYVTGITYCGYTAFCNYPNAKGTPYAGSVMVASSKYNGTSFTTVDVVDGIAMNQTFGPFYNPAPQLAWGTGNGGYLELAFIGGVSTPTDVGGVVVSGASVTPDLYLYTSSDLGLTFTYSAGSENAILPPSGLWGGLSNSSQLVDLALVPRFSTVLSLEATVFNGSTCLSGYCGAETEVALNVSEDGLTWSPPWVVSGALSPNGTSGGWSDYLTGEYEAAIQLGSPANVLYAWDTVSCPSWSGLKAGSLGQCGTFSGTGGTPVWTLYGTSQVALSTRYAGATAAETFSAAMSIPANATWGLEFMGGFFASNGSANITLRNVPLNVPEIFNGTAPGLWKTWSEFVGGSSTPASPYSFPSANGKVDWTFQEDVPLTLHLLPLLLAGGNCNAGFAGYCPLFSTPPGPNPHNINPYNCQFTTCYNPPTGATTNIAADLTCVAYYYSFYANDPGFFLENIVNYEGVGCANSYIAHTVNGAPVANLTYNQKTFIPVGKSYTISPESWSVANTLCGLNLAGTAPPGYASYTNEYYETLECSNNFFVELTPLAWIGNGSGSVTSSALSITVDPTQAINESVDWNITGYCTGAFDEYFFLAIGGAILINQATNQTPCYPGNPYGNGTATGVPVPLTIDEKGLPAGTEWGLQASAPGVPSVTKTGTRSSITTKLLSGSTYALSALTIPIPKTGQYWIGTLSNTSVTMPDFTPISVSFVAGSLAGRSFSADIVENGLPSTSGWTLAVTNGSAAPTNYTELPGEGSTSPIFLAVGAGDTYAFNGSSVTTSNGVEYYPSLVNVSVVSINGTQETRPPWQVSALATGEMLVNITYAPAYYVTVQSTPGGTTLNGSQFVDHGRSIALTAKPDPNDVFSGWVGVGNGSVSSSSLTITVKPGNPITEFAVFRPQPTPTWTLHVTGSGLPFGQTFSLTVDGNVTYSGSGTFPVTNITGGNHTFTAPTAYAPTTPPDVRYTPTRILTSFGGNTSVPIHADGNVTVTFSTSYLLTLSATPGGTVSGASTGTWLSMGAPITLSARPDAGFAFVGWNGTGSGSYTGPDATAPVTADGPITEIAEFVLIPPPPAPKYNLTVTETGLPSGIFWNASVGIVGASGAAGAASSQIVLGDLAAAPYTLHVPIVYGSSGVRYVPNVPPSGESEAVGPSNVSASVTFTTEYLVTVLVAGNGTVSSGSEWVASGQAISLTATPSSTPSNGVGWRFASWNGSTGSENTSTATLSLEISGPTTVTATFVPAYSAKSTTLQFLNAPIGFALLGGLLVVGLALAYAATRRRRPPARSEAAYDTPAEPTPPEAPPTPPSEAPDGPGGDEGDWAETDLPEGRS